MDRKLPLYIADLNESADRLLSLSIVEHPASGYKWKVIRESESAVDVFAPVLPCNVPIYRNNDAYGEHYVMFLADVISDVMCDASNRGVPFDIEHNGKPIDGVCVLSSFQIDYKRNTLYNGYQGLTDGTWVTILRLDKGKFPFGNMMNGALRGEAWPLDIFGISISGIFSYHKVTFGEAIEFLKA